MTAYMPAEAHRNHGFDWTPDRVGVDVCVNAQDDAALAQRPDAHQSGGLGDARLAGQRGVGGAAVGFEQLHELAIRGIEGLGSRDRGVGRHTGQPISETVMPLGPARR